MHLLKSIVSPQFAREIFNTERLPDYRRGQLSSLISPFFPPYRLVFLYSSCCGLLPRRPGPSGPGSIALEKRFRALSKVLIFLLFAWCR